MCAAMYPEQRFLFGVFGAIALRLSPDCLQKPLYSAFHKDVADNEPMAYSMDLRERVVRAAEEYGKAEAGRRFSVSYATVKVWVKRAAVGQLEARTSPGRPRLVDASAEQRLLEQAEAYPDATLDEHCAHWKATTAQRLSSPTMSRALRHLGWTRKKDPIR